MVKINTNKPYVMIGSEYPEWYEFVKSCWKTLADNNMTSDNRAESDYYFYCIYGAELENYNAKYDNECDYHITFSSYNEFIRFKLSWT